MAVRETGRDRIASRQFLRAASLCVTICVLLRFPRVQIVVTFLRTADEKEQKALGDRLQTKIKILDDHVISKTIMPGMCELVAAKAWEDFGAALALT